MISAISISASIFSGALTLLLCLYSKQICHVLGIMDVPDARKQHRSATPLMGGVAIELALLPVAAFLILFVTPPAWQQPLLIWLVCTAAMTLVGLADDRHTLSARDRLMISFLVFGSAAIVSPLFNIRVLTFDLLNFQIGLGTGWIAIIFTTICCVGLVNAVNMADGKNGLVIGLCIGWLILLALRAPPAFIPMIAVLLAILTILLMFNLRGRLFLGDGGAYGLASAIGLLAVMVYNSPGVHAGRAIAADELMLLFAVPVIDSFRLTFVRMRRGQSPMAADRDHLHHHLQNRFGWPGGLVVYLLMALVPAAGVFAVDL